jgi:acetyl esterase
VTLHPQARAALSAPSPVPATLSEVEALRAEMEAGAAAATGPGTPVPVVADVDAGGVPCRLYDPRNGHGAPVVVYLHGGGWVAGSLETVDSACRRLADRSGCAVLSVGYRLAPEHPWPAAITDAEAAVAWLRAEADAHGLDATRLAVAGDSAGGNLAAVLARRARDAGTPFALQVLIYPTTDAVAAANAVDPDAGAEHGLSLADMAAFWNHYLPAGADRKDPDISPAYADSLAGLPRTLVITAEHDVLTPEAEAYADALADAGVTVVHARYQGMVHSFFRLLAVYDAAAVAVDQAAAAVRDALDGPARRN